MEKAVADGLLEDIDEKSISGDQEPATKSRREVNSASAEIPLRRHRVTTRSVTTRKWKKSIASVGKNTLAMTDGEMAEATVLTETFPDNPVSRFKTNKSAGDLNEYKLCDLTEENNKEESSADSGKSWRDKLRDVPRGKKMDRNNKNGKKRKSVPLTRSIEKGVKNKRQNKPRRKFPCKICGKPYTKFYMDAHMQLHSGEKPFCCQEQGCKRQFATEYYLRMHVQRCHGKPQCYPCVVCDKKLASKRGLIEHARIHSEERPFVCQVCGKGFRQPALLFNHIKTHDDLMPFQCEQCGIRYKYKRSMERHKEKIHDGILHVFPCKLCERVFSTKSKLKEHQYFHEGNSPHVCEICGKRLLARKTLQNHMLIHQGEKPYRCEICGKMFRFVIVLKRHLSVHTGVKPFRCDKCGRQFIHRVYMDRHKCAIKAETVLVDSTSVGELSAEPLDATVVGSECVDIGQVSSNGDPLNVFVSPCDELG